jgi:hypothetical protein
MILRSISKLYYPNMRTILEYSFEIESPLVDPLVGSGYI